MRFFVPLLICGVISGRASATCTADLNRGRRILFVTQVEDELMRLRRTDGHITRDQLDHLRVLFKFEAAPRDDDTDLMRGSITTDVLERRVRPTDDTSSYLANDLARRLKLFGRVLAVRDGTYLVATPPAGDAYDGYQFVPLDLYFVSSMLSVATAGSRASRVRQNVEAGIHGVVRSATERDEMTHAHRWYVIDGEPPVYSEHLMQLMVDDVLINASYQRAIDAF